MEILLQKLKTDFPKLNFEVGKGFYWSPQSKSVIYQQESSAKNRSWTLLHEVAHAQLKHSSYKTDVELLTMEVAAWEEATKLAAKYKLSISNDHIQNCLDSYRNWLHVRSTCPTCESRSLQYDTSHYQCFNCHTIWKVSAARFCRPYRRVKIQKETSPEAMPRVMFL